MILLFKVYCERLYLRVSYCDGNKKTRGPKMFRSVKPKKS